MQRRVLTDGSGRWFDIDKAERFDEATRRQWDHEVLYRTAGGRWILHRWSGWEGMADTWVQIDDAAAARWLVINGYGPHPACEAEFQALQIA